MADPKATSAKLAAQETMSTLPNSATWEDVMYALYVRESIEAGMADVDAGREISHAEASARLRSRFTTT